MKKNYFKHFILSITIVLFTNNSMYSQVPGAALNFDGNNDKVNIGVSINAIIDPLNKFTVEAWVKNTAYTNVLGNGLGCIVGNYNTSGGGMQFLLRRDGSTYTFWVDCGSGFQVAGSAGGTALLNTWQHVVGTWDGTWTRLYIDDVLHAINFSASGPSFVFSGNPILIGSNTVNENFTGEIDEVRIWSVAKTACEIKGYMGCEIPSSSPGLLANYHANQGIASSDNTGIISLTDASGAARTGTLQGFALNGSTSNWVAPSAVVSNFTLSSTALSVPSGSICLGNEFLITPYPAGGSYTITGGAFNVSPISNTSYTVTSGPTAPNGCPFTSTMAVSNVTVVALPLPVITLTADKSVVCLSEMLTLTASGATAYYRWSMGSVGAVYPFFPTTTATYTVYGYDNNGCYNTATISATVTNCTAIEELNSSNLFSMYPNPSNGEFYLDLNTDNTTVTIFDAVGNVVYTEKLNSGKQQINLMNQAAGLYFIQAKNNDRTYSVRMIKE